MNTDRFSNRARNKKATPRATLAWAHRAYDLGVGSKPIYAKELGQKSLQKKAQKKQPM